jgi:hypothetical protein
MSATVRRYEGIETVRSEESTREIGERLLPALRKLPGFSGCYVFDDGEGVLNLDRSVEDSKDGLSRRASPRPGCVSRSPSRGFRTPRRSPPVR